MKLLRAAAEAQIRATAFRIITQRVGTDELIVQLVPLMRQLLTEGAVDINVRRGGGDRLFVAVAGWVDDE